MADPLIITASPTDGWTYKSSEFPAFPDTVEEIAQATKEAYDAGAAIAHLHGPWDAPQGGRPTLDLDAWRRMATLVRELCPGMIVQFGVAGGPLEQRQQLMESPGDQHPDMMSVCLTEHDYNFAGKEMYIMHTRPELIDYSKLCEANNVKPEYEVFHIGAYYNLRFTIENAEVPPQPPYWLTQFIGSTGGVWTPGTVDELDYRIRHLPDDCLWQVCPRAGIKGTMTTERHRELVFEGILRGGHVRVGIEDNPYIDGDTPARNTAEQVERVVKFAEVLGRPVATPEEARAILKLPAA